MGVSIFIYMNSCSPFLFICIGVLMDVAAVDTNGCIDVTMAVVGNQLQKRIILITNWNNINND